MTLAERARRRRPGGSGDRTFFISGQDPDLDVGFGQFGNGFRNPVLKFILDGSRADQLEKETSSVPVKTTPASLSPVWSTHHEVLLNLFVHPVQGLLSVGHGHLGVLVLPGPGSKLVRADVLVAQAQRPQGGVGKFLRHKKEKGDPDWTVGREQPKLWRLLGRLTSRAFCVESRCLELGESRS